MHRFDEEIALDEDLSSIVAIDKTGRIVFVNEAYRRFGRENGASAAEHSWCEGCDWRAAIPSALNPFFDDLFARAKIKSPVSFSYECSSPTMQRMFRMSVYALPDDGFLMVHALTLTSAHAGPLTPAVESAYQDAHGVVPMCMHCRRVRHMESQRWDWVPAWVEHPPPRVSHGLCPPCCLHFYP